MQPVAASDVAKHGCVEAHAEDKPVEIGTGAVADVSLVADVGLDAGAVASCDCVAPIGEARKVRRTKPFWELQAGADGADPKEDNATKHLERHEPTGEVGRRAILGEPERGILLRGILA